MMKKLSLLLMLLTLGLPLLWATPTAKVLYCADNATLYFVYDEAIYSAEGSFTPSGSETSHTITAVYDNLIKSSNQMYWGTYRDYITTVDFQPGFENCRPTNTQYWFCSFVNLTTINNIGRLNTSSVINMKYMFSNCKKLTTLDVTGFNTEKVENMSYMFDYCQELTSLNVTGFNTVKVTDMSRMFKDCRKLTSLPLPANFGSNASDLSYLFFWCIGLSSLNLTNLSTAKATSLAYMFGYCQTLTSITFPANFGANATSMISMFSNCLALPSLDLTNLSTAKATSMTGMFQHCDALTSITFPENFGAVATDMSSMFDNCLALPSVDLSNFSTANVTNMSHMFFNCSNLKSLDVTGFNTKKVKNIDYFCSNCDALTSVTFGKDFDLGSVTSNSNKASMFLSSYRLRYIDFSASDDTDAITTVNRGSSTSMFNGTPQTTVIYLPHGATMPSSDTRNVVYTDGAELKCEEYYSIDRTTVSMINIYNCVELPYAFKTKTATYSRTMPNDQAIYATTVLPYDFASNDAIRCYVLNKENPVTMQFLAAATVPAHTPFLFEKLSGVDATFTVTDENSNYGITVEQTRDTSGSGGPYTGTTTSDGWTAKGYYVDQTVEDYTDEYYITNNKFWKADGPLTLYPHRVTFHGQWIYNNGNAPLSIAILNANGEEHTLTDIEAVGLQNAVSGIRAIYDAQGRRIPQMQKGLNIVQMEDGRVLKIKE